MSDRPAAGAAFTRLSHHAVLRFLLTVTAGAGLMAALLLSFQFAHWTKVASRPQAWAELEGFDSGAVAAPVVRLQTLSPRGAARPAARPSRRPTRPGALVICGGGKLPEQVRRQFIDLAGGPRARIVVIPTAHPSADTFSTARVLEVWTALGVAPQVLHTRSPEKANDPEFVKPLTEATGVWLGGGRQQLLTEAYLGTEVERLLSALLERGGVIGGTSAGAAVMTRVMIESGREKAKEGRGFDFLPGAVVDQHFLRRNRIGRLLEFLSRHPDLVGFGVDEGTALIVRGNELSVLGDHYVLACLPGVAGHPERLKFLKSGDRADLAVLSEPLPSVDEPAPERGEVLASSAQRGK